MAADPTSGPARYAVVIPHFNDVVRLERCLAALEAQDRREVEVVVADNNSSVDLSKVASRFDWVRFVTQPEPGAGLARNAGVAATSAPWLFFIDADCLPAGDWLTQARRIADGDPGTVTGGRVDVFHETPPPCTGAEAFETVFAFNQEHYIRKLGFSVTANLLAPREVFAAVGGFRAGLSEDLEWCHRATAGGYQLSFDTALVVFHPTRSDWPALRRKWRRLTEESFALQQAQGKGRAGWALRACAMPASILVHAPRILSCRTLSPREKAAALVTLARLRMARMAWMLRQAAGLSAR